ncbi:hypothetical protein ABK905_12360 [Acerihabitans sp. KWT182]|uniref:Uncharacterized protein n=1 Tax=Acerihabitans sp. KWT182 TaxID=3157919 RepID=A0AAU7QG50_9GAMM
MPIIRPSAVDTSVIASVSAVPFSSSGHCCKTEAKSKTIAPSLRTHKKYPKNDR